MLSQATSPSERWKDVFKAMESLAPRVGNCLISMSHDMAHQVQNSCSASNASSGHLYVCRGTERFQLPLSIPDRDRNRIRYTVRLHRSSGTVHDFGCEDSFALRRNPSKLMITSFGYLTDVSGSMESWRHKSFF